jgi:hypothetical protein
LEPEVQDRLSVLVRYDSAIAVFGVLEEEKALRARVSGNGRFAVLAVQGPKNMHIEVVEPHRLIASIIDVLPVARPFPGRLVKVLDEEPPVGSTPDDEAARRMLGSERERAGYFTVYGQDPRGRAVQSPELAWTDTVNGRFVSRSRTGRSGRRFTTHEPADRATLVNALRELVSWVHVDD